MNRTIRSVTAVMAGAAAVLLGLVPTSAQATVDAENGYPNVGALMVWRVDDSAPFVYSRASVRRTHAIAAHGFR
jgi:hypothetical protein